MSRAFYGPLLDRVLKVNHGRWQAEVWCLICYGLQSVVCGSCFTPGCNIYCKSLFILMGYIMCNYLENANLGGTLHDNMRCIRSFGSSRWETVKHGHSFQSERKPHKFTHFQAQNAQTDSKGKPKGVFLLRAEYWHSCNKTLETLVHLQSWG